MRFYLILFLILLYTSNSSGLQVDQQDSKLRKETIINTDNILQLLKEQLDLGPRIPGTKGSILFGEWIKEKISDPWSIEMQNFTYKNTELKNYIITYENQLTYPSIIIAAHYDSRAVADQDKNILKQDDPVPGANDAASGVAAIIEMMNYLPETVAKNIQFILFDGEDQGSNGIEDWDWIVGSTYYANNMTPSEINSTDAMILLDMIGDDELNLPYERNSDRNLVDQFWQLANNFGYDMFIDKPGYSLIDDHIPFRRKGIPTLDIIDFDYSEWHTVNDNIKNISEISIAIVTDVTFSWLMNRFNTTYSNKTSKTISFSTTENVPLYTSWIILIIIPLRKKYYLSK